MITITTQTELRHSGGFCVPAPSDDRVRHLELIDGRRLAPFYAPQTGAVRPQAGDSALIATMTAVQSGKGTDWGRTWSPPD
jgi:hypothetical protein